LKGKLFSNIGFLTLSQAANYMLPLITIPYVTRVVGPEKYGLIEFGTVAMLYFSAVVIYGFNTTATRKIAEYSENKHKVSAVFSAVVFSRLLLFLGATIVFSACMFVVPEFAEHKKVMLFAYPIVLGWALYPDFLFQGLQNLKVVAIANFAVKSLSAVLIFVLLRTADDYYLVLGINSLAQILVGAFTLIYAFKGIANLAYIQPKWRSIRVTLKNGLYVFLSHLFTRIYTFGSILFLGIMLTELELGYFAAGMKLVIVGQSFMLLPLSGALFPYLAKLYKENRARYLVEFKRALWVMVALTAGVTLVLILFSGFFINLVFGSEYAAVKPYFQIMAPILVFSALSHFAMQQGLIILKKDRRYLNIIMVAGTLSLALNFFVIPEYRLLGAAWVKLGIDALIAALGAFYFYKAWKAKS
jgi:PST family polysaccharide transporter